MRFFLYLEPSHATRAAFEKKKNLLLLDSLILLRNLVEKKNHIVPKTKRVE